MQQNKKRRTAFIVARLVLSCLAVIAFSLAGVLLGDGLSQGTRDALGVPALILLAVLVLLLALSWVGAYFYKKSKQISLQKQQEYLLSRKEEAEKDLEAVVKRVKRFRYLMKGSAWALLVFALGIAFLFGLGGGGDVSASIAIFPMYLCYGALSRLFPYKEKYTFEGYCNPEDYPELHALAHKAATAVGEDGPVRIVFLNDCNAGIARIGKTYSLQLGVNLLDVMSREELYEVLLHEFAHLTKDGNPTDKEYALFSSLAERENTGFDGLVNILFALPDAFYTFEYFVYRVTSSVVIEQCADRAIFEKGDPQTAINGMAKLGYYHLFEKELQRFIEDHYYSSEQPRENTCQVVNEAFRRAVIERGDFYKSLLLKEIQPRSASHPILRYRMEALGVKDFTVILPDHADAYGTECKRAAQAVSKEIAEAIKENYEEVRKEQYLKPLAVIEEYRKTGQTLPAEEARPVFDALMAFSYYEEAEALCDRLFESTENKFATAHAHYTKGCILLGRYDDGGIEQIYQAMELNHNYVEEGLFAIGEYCCLTGNEEGIEEYRRKAMTYGQKQIDEVSHTGELTVKDHLSAETMPKEMLDDILAFMKKADEEVLDQVHLVRKQITDEYFCSFFILHFKQGAEDEKMVRVYDKIFNHLDTRPEDWHFSLFVYDDSLKAVMKKIGKIEGSLVYKAE
ncbi:MAG: hypothetical protein J6M12_08415 [Clostridia bacterium]|nr:hypothetical protein [Clostridia bacterium]